MTSRLVLLSLLALSPLAPAADPSYDEVLARFNRCLGRGEPVGFHVWSGSPGHREIGNLLVSVVHAFVDGLMHNRLVVGRAARAGWAKHRESDIGLQALLMALLPVRLGWAPAECAGHCRGHASGPGAVAATRVGAVAASIHHAIQDGREPNWNWTNQSSSNQTRHEPELVVNGNRN